MTLPVAFPSWRDTGSCVRGEQAVLCSAGSCQCGTVRRAGGCPGQHGARSHAGLAPNVSVRGGQGRCKLPSSFLDGV